MKSLFSYLLTAALVLPLGSAQAQGTPGEDEGSPGGPAGATGVPIDGGASLLLASGVAYGLRRLRQRRRLPT